MAFSLLFRLFFPVHTDDDLMSTIEIHSKIVAIEIEDRTFLRSECIIRFNQPHIERIILK